MRCRIVSLMRGRRLTMRSKKRKAATDEHHFDHALAVLSPLLDLVEVAVVRDPRLFGFFVGP